MSLSGGPERPLYNTAKEKPGMLWRPQEVRDTRAMEYVLKRPANRVWSQPKRKKCAAINKAGETIAFAVRHGDAMFGVPQFLQSCFGPAFPHCAPTPTSWNGDVYPVPLYVRRK